MKNCASGKGAQLKNYDDAILSESGKSWNSVLDWIRCFFGLEKSCRSEGITYKHAFLFFLSFLCPKHV